MSRLSDLTGLLQCRAAGVDDEPGDDVRVAVRVRTAVLDVALLVDLDLPRDAHRGAPVGHSVAVLVPRGGLVQAGEPVLDVGAVALNVLLGPLPESLTGGDDRLVALAHRL